MAPNKNASTPKLCFLIVWSILTASVTHAQIPTTQIFPNTVTQTVRPVPAAYNINFTPSYVRIWVAEKPITSDTAFVSSSRTLKEVRQTTTYADGLGRIVQTVVKGASPAGRDIVTPALYDTFGKQNFQYLPYVAATNDGNWKANPFADQSAFLKTMFNPTNNANGEKFFYTKTDYEASPLNRSLKSYAPGNSWVGNAAGASIQYQVNAIADSVVRWNNPVAGGVPVRIGNYAAGQLYKTVMIDERNNQVIEYKNKSGQIILKKVQVAASVSTAHTGWLCTYYIYDDIGNLRYVLQPKATDWLKVNNWTFDATTWKSSALAKELIFSYEYDVLNRLIVKRVPGAGEMWLVYDGRDRMVMSQDSVLRSQGKWLYTQYDSLNRPLVTGTWTTTGDRVFHQNLAGNSTVYPNPSSNFTILTQTYYDNYAWVSSSGSGLSSSLITTYTGNTNYFYAASNTTFPYPQNITATTSTNGKITGTKINAIGTGTYLYNVTFYDDKDRIIQIQTTNYSGGKDTTTMQFSFSGRLLRTLMGHGKAGTGAQNYLVFTKFTYDAVGHMLQTDKKIGNSPQVTIAKQQYDELGRLKQKNIGQTRASLNQNTYTAQSIDSLKYSYNLRGWLSAINKDYARNENGASNWFGMELSYDYGFTQTQLNGNIAGIRWRNKGDGEQRAYGFGYDAVNRLTKADFTQYTGAWNISAGVDFSVTSMSYDANGNILSLNQKGLKLNTSVVIDSLLYSYVTNSNRLNYVTDRANDTAARLGDFTEINNNTTQDYWYDANGSLTKDNNKKISNINYNYLNLPQSINVQGKGTISYVYDAAGNKLQKITMDSTISRKTVTTYIAGFVYQYKIPFTTSTAPDTLQFIGHEEGRVRPKSPAKTDTMYYDYMEKDHLGNTRVVLTDEQQQNTYPVADMEKNTAAMNVIRSYYTINMADTFSISRIPSFSLNSSNTYNNNNGNPPYNTNPSANTGAANAIMNRLNGSTGSKTGISITLKVMSGDAVNIFAKSYYHLNTTQTPTNTYLITSALNSFINGFAGSPAVATKGITGTALIGASATTGPLTSWLNGIPNPTTSTIPKAYINWILFDEQFKPVSAGSGYDPVNSAADIVKSHNRTVNIIKSGYLFVYCSNESNIDVFFDNLQIIQTRSPLLETTDYYPFGLTMAGISSKALNGIAENKIRFQGQEFANKEFSDGSGLDWYEFKYRMSDPQIGRFQILDPLTDDYRYNSPYAFSENRVTDGRELEGLEYVSMHHYSDGITGIKMHYKSTDAEINKIHGTTAGIYNSASYGPLGKGVVHYFYNSSGEAYETRWEQQQTGGSSDFRFHGLYSGPGSITKDGGGNSTKYDFSFQPLDWSDAIAKRHDMDYAAVTATGEAYAGFLEDIRTLQADKDMVERINDYTSVFRDVKGVETPYRTSYSEEMDMSMVGQRIVIGALAAYKQWKIDNGYGNKDTYNKLRDQFVKKNPGYADIIDLIIQ